MAEAAAAGMVLGKERLQMTTGFLGGDGFEAADATHGSSSSRGRLRLAGGGAGCLDTVVVREGVKVGSESSGTGRRSRGGTEFAVTEEEESVLTVIGFGAGVRLVWLLWLVVFGLVVSRLG